MNCRRRSDGEDEMNDSYASSDGFPALIRILSEASEWIVLSHVKPDGDALGSASAFASVGRKLGKTVVWGGPDEYPSRYLFLEGSGEFRPNLKLSSLALTEGSVVLALDTSTRARSVEDLDALPENVPLLNVDHHEDNELFGTVNYVDPSSSSTGEIAWLLLREWGIPLEIDVLEAVYTALATDCGNFAFSCTTPRTHRVAAELLDGGVSPAKLDERIRCNASIPGLRLRAVALSRAFVAGGFAAFTWLRNDDFLHNGSERSATEFLVNDLLTLKDVSFAAFFVEDEECVRVSLRSRGVVLAAEIARVFGGGGHPQAAGCKLPLPLSDAVESVRSLVEERYAERIAPAE